MTTGSYAFLAYESLTGRMRVGQDPIFPCRFPGGEQDDQEATMGILLDGMTRSLDQISI